MDRVAGGGHNTKKHKRGAQHKKTQSAKHKAQSNRNIYLYVLPYTTEVRKPKSVWPPTVNTPQAFWAKGILPNTKQQSPKRLTALDAAWADNQELPPPPTHAASFLSQQSRDA